MIFGINETYSKIASNKDYIQQLIGITTDNDWFTEFIKICNNVDSEVKEDEKVYKATQNYLQQHHYILVTGICSDFSKRCSNDDNCDENLCDENYIGFGFCIENKKKCVKSVSGCDCDFLYTISGLDLDWDTLSGEWNTFLRTKEAFSGDKLVTLSKLRSDIQQFSNNIVYKTESSNGIKLHCVYLYYYRIM